MSQTKLVNTEFYTLSPSEVLDKTNGTKSGLSESERVLRLKTNGENTLGQEKKTNYFLKFISQFKDVMVIILLVAAFVSLGLSIHNKSQGEMIDSLVIFLIVLINATIGFLQEVKAENALENLKKMSQPYATILENGTPKKVKTSQIVVGDIVLLETGDIVPADLYLLESASLKCDESALTGESEPAQKEVCICKKNTPLAERKNICYTSSSVVYGHAKGVVVSTGKDTEMGKIASMITKTKKESTPLQKSLTKLGEIITFVVLSVAIIIFLIDVIFAHHSYVESFLTAIAIAVAAIPESMPAVVTIILSIGVTRLAKKGAIVKKLHAVETLGSCSVICSDKTGTITQNKMKVEKTFIPCTSPLSQKKMLSCMRLCNDAKKGENALIGDPTEIALLNFAIKNGQTENFDRINELPFDSKRKMMSVLVYQNGSKIQYTKGGVDEVLSLSTKVLYKGKIIPLSQDIKEEILSQNSLMAKDALRVLAFAYKEVDSDKDFAEEGLVFIGLAGMIDPPRKEVEESIKVCKRAGLSVVMITGDHKATATAVAKRIGIITKDEQVINGEELDKISDKELAKVISKYRVFARVSPEHKVRIVRALQSEGKIVAMTGDGVNDAPSLKKANIGIGMGQNGTEVAKSVSDIILTDDNFSTIVVAVEEGRNIFSNIQKTIQFLLSCNIAEVITIFLLTLLFPQRIILSAVQILFINLVTDTFPAIALGVDKSGKDAMKKPPNHNSKYILDGKTSTNIIYQGLAQTLISILVYIIGINLFSSYVVASTMTFMSINMLQLFHMFNVRSQNSIFTKNPFDNRLLNFAFFVEMTVLFMFGSLPALSSLVGGATLSLSQWLITIVLSFMIIPICEVAKFCQNKKETIKLN